jgi:hypothetical protein
MRFRGWGWAKLTNGIDRTFELKSSRFRAWNVMFALKQMILSSSFDRWSATHPQGCMGETGRII